MGLWAALHAEGPPVGSFHGRAVTVPLADLQRGSILEGRLEELRGRTVLLATEDLLTSALALIELDGVARRIVLCPPEGTLRYFPEIIATSGADAWVRDAAVPEQHGAGLDVCITAQPTLFHHNVSRKYSQDTEWILLTSGTTGAPKLVLHTLATLTNAFSQPRAPASRLPVWSTFYDIRRYGGLQIFLRAAMLGGSLVLSDPRDSVTEFLRRAAAAGVTHMSGTPSHWRRVLMSGGAKILAPNYVRLSGEIADQAILDQLQMMYPGARVAHAFASTEAGVAFEVGDGIAGFPASSVITADASRVADVSAAVSESSAVSASRAADASMTVGASKMASEPTEVEPVSGSDVVDASAGAGFSAEPRAIELKVEKGTLRIRSGGNAVRYLGEHVAPIRRDDGFVDTGDQVELRDGRYYFMGRVGGVINVGGLKVHPEEVEAVINSHPRVRMSLVKARRSPITGALVTADVVLFEGPGEEGDLTQEIIESCRRSLPAHKVPAMVRIVPSLAVSEAGKLMRPNA